MTYTTQGLMTPADLNDFQILTDTGRHPECPGHDGEADPGPTYCSRAEICPDEDLEPL
jgi:hypothetical protein